METQQIHNICQSKLGQITNIARRLDVLNNISLDLFKKKLFAAFNLDNDKQFYIYILINLMHKISETNLNKLVEETCAIGDEQNCKYQLNPKKLDGLHKDVINYLGPFLSLKDTCQLNKVNRNLHYDTSKKQFRIKRQSKSDTRYILNIINIQKWKNQNIGADIKCVYPRNVYIQWVKESSANKQIAIFLQKQKPTIKEFFSHVKHITWDANNYWYQFNGTNIFNKISNHNEMHPLNITINFPHYSQQYANKNTKPPFPIDNVTRTIDTITINSYNANLYDIYAPFKKNYKHIILNNCSFTFNNNTDIDSFVHINLKTIEINDSWFTIHNNVNKKRCTEKQKLEELKIQTSHLYSVIRTLNIMYKCKLLNHIKKIRIHWTKSNFEYAPILNAILNHHKIYFSQHNMIYLPECKTITLKINIHCTTQLINFFNYLKNLTKAKSSNISNIHIIFTITWIGIQITNKTIEQIYESTKYQHKIPITDIIYINNKNWNKKIKNIELTLRLEIIERFLTHKSLNEKAYCKQINIHIRK